MSGGELHATGQAPAGKQQERDSGGKGQLFMIGQGRCRAAGSEKTRVPFGDQSARR